MGTEGWPCEDTGVATSYLQVKGRGPEEIKPTDILFSRLPASRTVRKDISIV